MASPAKAPSKSTEDWLRLQKKIFQRWVNQKLSKINVTVNDLGKDLETGVTLIQLLEVLSEKKYEGKIEKNPKIVAQKIDNASNALKFVFETCGVQMKIKPSAEDLVNGNEKNILGLIWAIMSKYMKFGDEEDGPQLSARDALLLWVQNKLVGYENVKIDNFGSSFHDGLALCALIHKHRPKLIDWSSLKRENKAQNLQTAFNAAEAYFGLEKYLTPEDIPKLDEPSMVVYVSEYYHGIAEQRKLDLAAARIHKVIKLTIENDNLRTEYNGKSKELKEHMTKVEKILEDRTIDNTMAGAKRKIEEFYDYKTKDKNVIIGMQLDLEGLYNTLAMKLSHNKRPEFQPGPGLTLKDIESAVAHLEAVEQERKVALHAELNRQVKLVKMDEQHHSRHEKLKSWVAEKTVYLQTKEHIDSVSAAQLQLRLLDAYDKESSAVHEGSFHQLKALGASIVSEKYEKSEHITSREAEIASSFATLAELSKAKRPVLEDDLAREQFKEKIRLLNQQHIANFTKLQAWVAEKEAYLNTREQVDSVTEARTQLSLLESYEQDKVSVKESGVAQLHTLGQEILNAKYETKYSSYVFEHPEDIKSKHAQIDQAWVTLSELSAEKKRVLDDHLAREEFKENVRTLVRGHQAKHDKLQAWIAEKEAYLKTKEHIESVSEARKQLVLLETYEKDKDSVNESNVAQLKKLGAEILALKYETKYSSYVFEKPQEIKDREAAIDAKWKELSELSAEKKRVLDDHLAREEFKEKVRRMNDQHTDKHNTLQSWITEQEAYLNTREAINSISEAKTELSLLASYEKDKESLHETNVAQLKKLGQEILAAKYHTNYSSYVFEHPDEVKNREASIDAKWKELSELSAEKKRVLDDHLAREEFKEKVRTQNSNHVDKHEKLQAWVAEKEAYLNTKEAIDSVSEATTHLSLLEAYEKEKQRTHETSVAQLKTLGAHILAQKYETKYSSWVFETPQEIKDREASIEAKWVTLTELSAKKKAVLEADLAREQEKERLRLEYAHQASEFVRWTKETSEDVAVSQFGFTLEEVEAYQAALTKSDEHIKKESETKTHEYKNVHSQMVGMGVTQNIYTKLSLDDLAKANTSLEGALSARQEAYNKELARQRANDQLCKDFAHLVEPFSKWISDQKDAITKSSASLEDQLSNVDHKIASVGTDGAKLKDIDALNHKLDEAGITNNKHTTLTAKDVHVQWEQYQAFLQRKKKMLIEEIEQHKLRGVTPEQLKEIEDNFRKFDADKSGKIDKKELKTCLYSLGEEKNNAEVVAILKTYGDGQGIVLEGFKNFMVGILAVSDSQDDILNAFKLINKGDEIGRPQKMEIVMGEEDLKYIFETAPKVDGGVNYKSWTSDVFSR